MAVNAATARTHESLASLDALLAPEHLTQVSGSAVVSVRRLPFIGGHSASGSRFLGVETNDGHGPRFVVKRISPAWDWIMRATDDRVGREAVAWTSGLLDRLPPEVSHPVVACAHDGAGWAVLMRDVSKALFPPHDPYLGTPIAAADDARILEALAALHAAFREEPEAADPAMGFCTPEHRFRAFSPETGRREADGPDVYPRIIREGWELLPELVDSDVAALVTRLADDPGPLTAALARYPQTVVHGDPRPPNLGLDRTGAAPRVMLLDWHFVGPGAPGADVAWYLYCAGPSRTGSREDALATYSDHLAQRLGTRFAESWWQPQIALSLLGQMLRCAQDLAWAAVRHEAASVREWARADLVWWSEQARIGARWL
jgi:hypothetical protein